MTPHLTHAIYNGRGEFVQMSTSNIPMVQAEQLLSLTDVADRSDRPFTHVEVAVVPREPGAEVIERTTDAFITAYAAEMEIPASALYRDGIRIALTAAYAALIGAPVGEDATASGGAT